MEIVKKYNQNELELFIKGRLDTITSQQLDKEINEENYNFNSLVIDFSNLEYISSAGFRVLIATQKKLESEDKTMIIRNVNDIINEIFIMSGFDKILKIE